MRLNRRFTTDIEVDGEKMKLSFRRMKATEAIQYSHEIEVLQERLKDEDDKEAVLDIYNLQLDMLSQQLIGWSGLVDEDGVAIPYPGAGDELRDMIDELGVQFITAAVNAFSASGKVGDEGKDKSTDMSATT